MTAEELRNISEKAIEESIQKKQLELDEFLSLLPSYIDMIALEAAKDGRASVSIHRDDVYRDIGYLPTFNPDVINRMKQYQDESGIKIELGCCYGNSWTKPLEVSWK